MSYTEKNLETNFFKRVKRHRTGAVPTFDQLNSAASKPSRPVIEHPAVTAAVDPIPMIYKRSITTAKRPPFLTLLPVIMLLLMGTSVQAQELHLSAGYNGSSVSKAGTENWEGRAGYQFGIDVLIGHRWFIKPGVHYVQRSLNYGVTNNALVVTDYYNYTSRAVAVPVMLGTYFLDPEDIKSFNAYFMAGPTALIGLNADLGNEILTVQTRGTQWYLGLGLGLSYGPVFLEGGYNAAMSNVFKGEGLDTNPRVNNTYVVGGVRLILAQ